MYNMKERSQNFSTLSFVYWLLVSLYIEVPVELVQPLMQWIKCISTRSKLKLFYFFANSACSFSGMVPLWAEIIVITLFLALLAIIVID